MLTASPIHPVNAPYPILLSPTTSYSIGTTQHNVYINPAHSHFHIVYPLGTGMGAFTPPPYALHLYLAHLRAHLNCNDYSM